MRFARTRSFTLALLLAVAIFSGRLNAIAGTTWDGGGGDDKWTTGNNWNDNTTPPTGTTVDLNFAGSTRLTPNNDYGNYDDFRSIYFNSGAGAFTISGSSIDFFDGKIENNSSSSQTLSIANFSFNNGTQEINPVSGDLTLGGGGFIYNNTLFMDVYGNNGYTLTLGKDLTGSGGISLNQNSVVNVTVSQSYTGDTFINAGSFRINEGGGLGSTIVRLGDTIGSINAAFYISDANGGTTEDASIVVRSGNSGTQTVGGLNTSGDNTFSGTVSLDHNLTLSAANGGRVIFSGQISDGLVAGTYGAAVNAAGTVQLAGSGANSGSTWLVQAGTLELNKTSTDAIAGTTTVQSGGTLKNLANNQINDSYGVTVDSGGTWNLNGSSETVSSLLMNGTLSLGAGQVIMNNGSSPWSGSVSASSGGSLVFKSGTSSMAGASTGLASGSAIYIDGGTLGLNNNSAAGSATIYLGLGSGSTSATLDSSTIGTSIGNAIIVRNNSGTMTIDNASGGAVTFGGGVTLSNNLTISSSSGETNTFSGVIDDGAGTYNITKSGSGILKFSNANTYGGTTAIDDGELWFAAGGSANNSTIYIGNGGTLSTTAKLWIESGGTTVNSAMIVNNGNANTRVIGGLNTGGTATYGGSLTINAADVNLEAASGGTVDFTGAITTSANKYITKVGTGIVKLSGSDNNTSIGANVNAGTLQLAKDSTASVHALNAAPIIGGGTLQLGGTGGNQIADTASVTINSGAFDLNGKSETINALTLNGTGISSSGALINSSGTAATLTLSANSTLGSASSIGGTGDITIQGDGAIRMTGGATTLTKVGNNVLTLSSGANVDNLNLILAASGGTTVLNKTGTGANGAHAVGGMTIGNGATVKLSGSGGYQIYEGATPTVSSGGVFDLNGKDQTFTSAGPTINGTGISGGGALVNNNTSASSTLTSALVLGSSSSIGGAGSFTITGAVSGGHALTKVGAGSLTLGGNNTFSGTLTVEQGKLNVATINNASANGVLGNSANAVVLGSSGQEGFLHYTGATASSTKTFTAASGGTAGIEVSNAATTLTLSGAIGGSGAVTKGGAGILALAGDNTFTGTLSVHDGTLQIATINNASANGVLGNSTYAVQLGKSGTANNATLRYTGGTTSSSKTFSLVSETNAAGVIQIDEQTTVLTLSAAISGAGRLEKSGAGTLVLSANNDYAGGTTLSAGALRVAHVGALGTGHLTQASGSSLLEFAVAGTVTNTMSVYNMKFTENTTLTGAKTLNNATYDVTSGDTVTEQGALTGTGGVTKNGAGTLILNGSANNTYTGATIVNAGGLVLSNSGGTVAVNNSSGITNNSGGSLILGASNQIGDGINLTLNGGTFITGNSSTGYAEDLGTLTLTASSVIDLGSNTTARNLVFDASNLVSWTSAQTLTISNWADNSGTGLYGKIYFGSSASGLTGTQLGQISFDIGGTLYGASLTSSGELIANVTPIPEPRVYAGAVALLAAVGWRERRRLLGLMRRKR